MNFKNLLALSFLLIINLVNSESAFLEAVKGKGMPTTVDYIYDSLLNNAFKNLEATEVGKKTKRIFNDYDLCEQELRQYSNKCLNDSYSRNIGSSDCFILDAMQAKCNKLAREAAEIYEELKNVPEWQEYVKIRLEYKQVLNDK